MPFFNKFGGGSSRSFGFGKAMAPQSAPTSLSAVASNTSVAISFTAPVSDGGSAITNYEYSFNNSTWTALSPADATSPITISGLTQNTAYTIYLRAVNSVGAGPASTGLSVTTAGVPTGTTTISSVSVGTTTATVNFSTGAGGSAITGYDYYLTSWVDAGVSSSPISLSGLTANTGYTVYVRPKNAYGVGPQSAGYSFTTVALLSIEYLAAGGGGGRSPGVYGAYWGAGGGGGAVRDGSILAVNGTYTCTVGGWGGNCGNGGSSTIVHSVDGTIASARYGGAAGGTTGGSNGDFSGGGGGGLDGGGGAGAAGNGGTGGSSGVGGPGKDSSITGSSLTYGGGGGGNYGNGTVAANGSCTSGYGRGGQANNALDSNCGSGSTAGSAGVVIVRYLTAVRVANGKTVTGGSVSTVGDYTLHTFTSTGNLVVS
jgi:hypothetical protein